LRTAASESPADTTGRAIGTARRTQSSSCVGAFIQTGYAGRLRARTGDLVIQPTLDTHANTTPSPGVTILRLPWPDVDRGGAISLVDLDTIVRAAERDIREAGTIARDQVRFHAPRACLHDLPDLLAADLVDGRVASLAAWAASAGVARETCAREFTTAFGVPAARSDASCERAPPGSRSCAHASHSPRSHMPPGSRIKRT
jgi:hypothetical protein